ncbi:MAG: cell division protein FtsB [Paracoccaceae bacterium]|jgi:cell division protein FtsB
MTQSRPAFAVVIYFALSFSLAIYFTFAAVQGDFGVFRRVEITAELGKLTRERDALAQQVSELTNKAHRMSDEYLDLDLLDEQARDVLGMIRADEIVFR